MRMDQKQWSPSPWCSWAGHPTGKGRYIWRLTGHITLQSFGPGTSKNDSQGRGDISEGSQAISLYSPLAQAHQKMTHFLIRENRYHRSNFRHTNRNLNRFWQITPGMWAIKMYIYVLHESQTLKRTIPQSFGGGVGWRWWGVCKVLCVGLDCQSHKLELGWPLHGSFFAFLFKVFSRKWY